MGCDIHLAVEKRERPGLPWERAEPMVPNPYRRWDPSEPELSRERWYRGRDYDLFGILADVRGERFPVLDEARGEPDDACAEVLEEIESWGVDGHSHSHLTLAEILAYDWMVQAEGWRGGTVTAWDEVCTHSAESFPALLLRMREVATRCSGNDDVRVVFWFDN